MGRQVRVAITLASVPSGAALVAPPIWIIIQLEAVESRVRLGAQLPHLLVDAVEH